MLRIHKQHIKPKALTAGVIAFSVGLIGTGVYVDRMQSFNSYENVSFDTSKNADAGVLGASSEKEESPQTAENTQKTSSTSWTSSIPSSATSSMSQGSVVQPAAPSGTSSTSAASSPTATSPIATESTTITGGMGGGSEPTTSDTSGGIDMTIVDGITVPDIDSLPLSLP